MKIILLSLIIVLASCSKNPQEAKVESRQTIFKLNQEINTLKRKAKLSDQEQEKVKNLQKELQEEISVYNKKYSKIKAN